MITHTINNNIIVHEYPGQIYIIKNLISNSYCNKMVNIIKQINFNNEVKYTPTNNIIGETESFSELNKLYSSQLNPHEQDVLMKLVTIFYSIYIRSIVYTIQKINYVIFDNKIPGMENVQLRKIHGATRAYVDGVLMNNSVRLLTCIIALNDDYTDGKFHFPNQNVDLKLELGDILLFPPYWSHPHYTDKPVGNVRYTITLWFTVQNMENNISVT